MTYFKPDTSPIGQLIGMIMTIVFFGIMIGWIFLLGWIAAKIVTSILPGFVSVPMNKLEFFRCGFLGFGLIVALGNPAGAMIYYPLALFCLYMIGRRYEYAYI